MISMEEKNYQLSDVLLTDIEPLGCSLTLADEPREMQFSRDYYDGCITFEDTFLTADCIKFVSGNVQILSICGEKAGLLYERILERQRKRHFPLAVRKFTKYLYILGNFGIGLVCSYAILCFKFKVVLLGMLIIGAMRILYTTARNHVR